MADSAYDSGAESSYEDFKVQSEQRQARSAGRKSGFEAMGLSKGVLLGVKKKGYKAPTPIQRKCIPLVLAGHDVVGMARTGSGKTAAFLLPMLNKLRSRSTKATGARALVIAPTRELALQTFGFTKQLGCKTGLISAVVVGGDSMEDQFSAIHGKPDVLIATPGRLLHLVVEMDLKLSSIQYVVFDEADRLFELGFEEQLLEVLRRLPEERQTLLFSATLPRTLLEFTRAGLSDPILVRLDVDTKISDKLLMHFLYCRSEEKLTVLLYLLHNIVDVNKESTIVFCATKYHVDLVFEILTDIGLPCSFLYSSLDPGARKLNIARFRSGQTRLLIVTDVAARGVDIPLIDNVINFHAPPKPKLFVHRVGRAARAGRSGRAFSILCSDELAYILDLFLFLGRTLNTSAGEGVEDCVIGSVPQEVIDGEADAITKMLSDNSEIESLHKVATNAMKQYMRTRPAASRESNQRVKAMGLAESLSPHPILAQKAEAKKALTNTAATADFLDRLRNFKPQMTIFEQGKSNKDEACAIMKEKRKRHSVTRQRDTELVQPVKQQKPDSVEPVEPSVGKVSASTDELSAQDIQNTFSRVVYPKFSDKSTGAIVSGRNQQRAASRSAKKDEQHFIPSQPSDYHNEKGLAVEKSTAFEDVARAAVLDLTADEHLGRPANKKRRVWDRKRKKYVTMDAMSGDSKTKKMKTESGTLINASYKTGRYEKWRKRQRLNDGVEEASDDEGQSQRSFQRRFNRGRRNDATGASMSGSRDALKKNKKMQKKSGKSSVRSVGDIAKSRLVKENQMDRAQKKRKQASRREK